MRHYRIGNSIASARQDITGTGVNIKLTRAMEILAGTPELAKYWKKADSVATVPPVTRVSDVKTMSTIVQQINAQTTQPVWTSFRPTDATVPQDSWENTAKRKYPSVQKDTIHVKTMEDVSTTRPTTAASARSASPASIVLPTWMTALIICARTVLLASTA